MGMKVCGVWLVLMKGFFKVLRVCFGAVMPRRMAAVWFSGSNGLQSPAVLVENCDDAGMALVL